MAATEARFEEWSRRLNGDGRWARAGAIAALMLRASAAGEVDEVQRLIDEAKSYGLGEDVLHLFEIAVETPREASPADPRIVRALVEGPPVHIVDEVEDESGQQGAGGGRP